MPDFHGHLGEFGVQALLKILLDAYLKTQPFARQPSLRIAITVLPKFLYSLKEENQNKTQHNNTEGDCQDYFAQPFRDQHHWSQKDVSENY